ncbi:MAG: hypothetical protein ACREOI_11020 [bacterium]
MRGESLFIPTTAPVFYALIASAVLLFASLAWLTFQRANRKRRAPRLAANFIAVLSLLAIALQPQWLSRSRPSTAVLITPGADLGNWQNLPDSIKSLPLAFSLDETQKWESINSKIQVMPDGAYLKRHYPEIEKLHVIGHGLNEYDWEALDSMQIEPHWMPLPLGIKRAQWSRELVLGQALQIQGVIAGLNGEESLLYLSDPGGEVDSVRIASQEDEAAFELKALLRETGKYLYTISLRAKNGGTRFEEKLGVVVTEPQPLRILVLENQVSFETKFLKIFLSKHRGVLAIRSKISRERYRFEYFNQPKIDLTQITANLLRSFEVAIIDGRTLHDLSEAERRALRAAVEQKGLGVLIMPDNSTLEDNRRTFSNREFFLDFHFERFAELDERLVKPNWPGMAAGATTAIPAEPFMIKNAFGMKPLIKDEMERTLAATYRRGQGQVGLSLVRDTYHWILEGHAPYHAAYWSYLLSALAPKTGQRDLWSVSSARPAVVDQPVQLTLVTIAARPVGIAAAEADYPDSLFLQQDLVDSQRWSGTFWPRQPGWHQVSRAGGEPHWFYAYEKESWQTWQAAERVAATQRRVWQNANLKSEVERRVHDNIEALPSIWFFLFFLFSCAYLWVERKW